MTEKIKPKGVPVPIRDGNLVSRLLVFIIAGFDNAIDKNEKLYLRLLCRLVDKSFSEYILFKDYVLEEIKSKDRLAYRFHIINHIENCINALDRVSKVFSVSKNEKNFKKIISRTTRKRIEKLSVSDIRNSVEHIERDIRKNLWQKGLFLDIDENYESVCINNKSIPVTDLVYMIEQYHHLVIEIFNGLPNQYSAGKFYYDKR